MRRMLQFYTGRGFLLRAEAEIRERLKEAQCGLGSSDAVIGWTLQWVLADPDPKPIERLPKRQRFLGITNETEHASLAEKINELIKVVNGLRKGGLDED